MMYNVTVMLTAVVYATLLLGAGSAELAFAANTCILELDRPLRDRENWSAQCGTSKLPPFPFNPVFTNKVSGHSENWLDSGIPKCRAGKGKDKDQDVDLCFEPADPEESIELMGKLRKRFPIAGGEGPPACYPPGKPEFVRIGHVMFHRSCFRVLGKTDHVALKDWGKLVDRFGPQPPDDKCHLDKLGKIEFDFGGNPPRIPAQQIWADRFVKEYPPKRESPRTAAEAIYGGFKGITRVVSKNGCLGKLNPDLAYRARQAMGIEFRAKPGPGGGHVFYRSNIDCREQVALECSREAVNCESAKKKLQDAYGERSADLDERLRGLLKNEDCRPVHPDGMTLGSIDSANLVAGDVVDGAPKIHMFNATALSGTRASGGPSTLLHEFLHAAGAASSNSHNHGTKDNELPAGDQVYACQAIAYQTYFDKLTDEQIFEACMLCAGNKQRGRCEKYCADPSNPVTCTGIGAGLVKDLKCRVK